jgi:hypothetical protein
MSKCKTCSDLQLGVGDYVYSFPELTGLLYKDIITSANQGCRGCILLRDGIQSCFPTISRTKPVRLSNVTIHPGNPSRLLFLVHFEDKTDVEVEFFTLEGKSH